MLAVSVEGMSAASPTQLADEPVSKQLTDGHRHEWEEYWAADSEEHDQNGPAEALRELLEDHRWLLPRGRCLVAGCGRGYDALYLAKRGHACVAVDFCDTAIAKAQKRQQWAETYARLIVPQGTLIVLLYPLIRRGQTPPYRVTMAECEVYLKRYFVLVRVDPNCRCTEGQEGNELMSVWKRL
ncbi:hypothetical protein GGH12_002414 [Coemansia sp. RSA 1822]|nr:hypothetical protein LPJ76_000227 [Coemansia sp. RSA 638]KAJ2124562.1 hypothetical protein IW147_001733 [Coemansia sp. RSA 720]KAJ2563718.1 hypothetical protein GGH12_002414 [Coemansia sp. RSA 1822]